MQHFAFFQLDNGFKVYLCHHVCICNIQRVFFQVAETHESQVMIIYYNFKSKVRLGEKLLTLKIKEISK